MIVSSIVLLHNVFTLDVKKLSAPVNKQRKYSATCHIRTLGFTTTSLKGSFILQRKRRRLQTIALFQAVRL